MDLNNLKIFYGVEKAIVNEILNNSQKEIFSPGDTIIVEGDESNGKGYIIESGEVEISIKGNPVAKLGAGEIFGEIALLNEEERIATVKSLTDLEVIVITLDNLIKIVNNGNTTINEDIMDRIEANLKNNL